MSRGLFCEGGLHLGVTVWLYFRSFNIFGYHRLYFWVIYALGLSLACDGSERDAKMVSDSWRESIYEKELVY